MSNFPTKIINSTHKKNCFLGLVFCVFLFALLATWQSVKIWSYAKITPYKVTFLVLSKSDIVLNVQYDYGYGFVPGHVRRLMIAGENGFQEVAMSISAWKKVRNLRFSSPNDSAAVRVKSLEVSLKGGNVLLSSKIILASKELDSTEATFKNETSVNLPFIVQNLGH